MDSRLMLTRRQFLKTSAAGGGLVVAFCLGQPLRAEPPASAFEPNAWLTVDAQGKVEVRVASSEMGQGVMTAIPMLVAEELDANWGDVSARFAPVDAAYNNPLTGQQLTGGSTAVRGYWRTLRTAGAVARDMLVHAAARQWGVSADDCRAEQGMVYHDASRRSVGYGGVAALAATLPVPESVFIKDPEEFRLLGQSIARLDTPAKVDGSAVFGQDVRLPGMLTASVVRCPVFGGKLKRFDASKAKQIPGVRAVLAIPDAVAVAADNTWAALRGREALVVEWDKGPLANTSSADISARFRAAAERGGTEARREGEPAAHLAGPAHNLEAVYEVPYLAHACMEPMNCTAHVQAERCDVWVPTQAQTRTRQTAARITGLPAAKVKVNTTFLGGGFGRRSEQDFVADAVNLSKALGKPVKVMWTREDDIQHDHYRPATYNRLHGALDADGRPIAWRHIIAGPSILDSRVPGGMGGRVDRTSVEGAANLPYAIPHLEVRYAMVDAGVPVGFWRSVGSSQNAFVTECFLDELAALGGQDPYRLRHSLLRDEPRMRGVLERAATEAGWGGALPAGHARGIAVAESFGSYVAQVAEVSVSNKQLRVHRVVCALDCGMVVNPGIISAQMESGIVYGLTAALYGAITLEGGQVVQSNFDDYPLLAIDAMPQIDVHIVASSADPGGVGEPGTPPIAPAVANAVFAATGKPVRRLPIQI